MKLSLRTRLTLSYLALMLAVFAVGTPLAWLAVENLYLNTQSASLLAQAQLVAAALAAEPAPAQMNTPAPYSQASNAMPGIHTRVIDPLGGAVIDLLAPAQPGAALPLPQLALNAAGAVSADELMARPEIAQARGGQAATAIRSIDAAGGRRVLYAAAPVSGPDGRVAQIVYLATPLPDTGLGALPEGLRWQLAGVLLGAVLVAAGAGFWLAQRITRPLARLAGAAQAVAGGDLAQSVPEQAAIPELDVLGRAFNHMTASLRQSDQAKTAFISDVTHELRTPLTVIKGTIETLEDGAMDDLEARGPFLAAMNRETERLIRLVNDLLVLTRADAGALNLNLQVLDLAALARQRCAHLERRAAARGVTLRVLTAAAGQAVRVLTATPGQAVRVLPAAAGVPVRVQADPDRLAQVLDNLLDNAIRYSPAGATVSVSLAREGAQAVLRVSDQGPGIAAQHLALIFERFYRADPGRDRGQGGAGLGLAIVRSLVQAHGGTVSVDSIEGQGATFTVRLPATD